MWVHWGDIILSTILCYYFQGQERTFKLHLEVVQKDKNKMTVAVLEHGKRKWDIHMISGFLHSVWKTFTVRQVSADFTWKSSAHSVLNIVPHEEKSALSAHSLCENMQRYKTFVSIIRMKSHVNGRTRVVTVSLKMGAEREKMWSIKMCEYNIGKSLEGKLFCPTLLQFYIGQCVWAGRILQWVWCGWKRMSWYMTRLP